MRRVHLIGWKNHGKTTLACEIIAELGQRGWRVGAVKHTGHAYPLDKRGSDSDQHATAGAAVNAFVSGDRAALWQPAGDDPYATLAVNFASCDLVLVEGDRERDDAPRIECWRDLPDAEPPRAASGGADVLVSDQPPADLPVPCLPRSDVARVATWIEQRLGLASTTADGRLTRHDG